MEALLLLLAAGIGGVGTALITSISNRDKTKAETEHTIVESAGAFVQMVRAETTLQLDTQARRIDSLESRVVELTHNQQKLTEGVEILTAQLQDEGIKPGWP